MKRLFTILSAGFTYFCVATVISLAAILTGLWFKGALDQERVTRVLAALHGIDVVTMHQQLVAQQAAANTESISRSERLEQQKLQNLDLDMREAAIANALAEMRTIQTKLELETNRFEDLKKAYASNLQKLADEEQATSLRELQRTLEAIKPDQAKEQILKMLDDNAMDDVVTVIKGMSIDKRKKLIGEFQQGSETDALYDILKNIRLGEPIASQIRDAQEKLREFGGPESGIAR